MLFNPGEFKDIWNLLCAHNIKEGNFIKEFEEKFKHFVEVKEAIAVSSGRFGLYLILRSLGLNKGDNVLLSAYNFKGVPKALLQDGFNPIFIDADEKTYQINPVQIEKRIDGKVKAIILTHLFGQSCEIDKIRDIAGKKNLFLIEDAAHSLGSYYHGKHTGSFGQAGFFSFAGSKTLNTSFGGMIVTNDSGLANKIRQKLGKYNFPTISRLLKERITTYIHALLTQRLFYSLTEYPLTLLMSIFQLDPLEIYKSFKHRETSEIKMRFSNLQALLGLRQMGNLSTLISRRKTAADKILQRLDSSISSQSIPYNSQPNYFMFPLKAKDKQRVFKSLLLSGIDSNLNYANDCSGMCKDTNAPAARFLSKSILTIQLPFYLNDKEIDHIASSLNRIKELLY
ncbi:MAG: aminotransferase class I/II-fold pyridoxal phosphate-dependent enzyme [Candidatus Omnitrophica bacterium]|nr:aminotransferase class I/II-fold pyridoxal phosphate-dependent enzyme [Candidatus Omnitrophota bacterium]